MKSSAPHHCLIRRLVTGLALLWALLGMTQVLAAPPAAGTLIDNTATATYVDSGSGLSVRLQSNTVEVSVLPLEGCTVSPGQSIVRSPGATFALPHTLSNTGNVTETCVLDLNPLAGARFTPVSLAVVHDLNGNGVADPGEPVIPAGAGISLAAGASVDLLVTGRVPGTASPGQSVSLQLVANSRTQNRGSSSTDTVAIASGAVISVTKSASTQSPTPGAPLSYTLSAGNQGGGAAAGVPVQVDGVAQNLFLLRDEIPANTTLQSLSAAGAALALYHRLGDAADSYLGAPPGQAVIDGIAWGVPSLAPGATLIGEFTVMVNANAAGRLDNTAYADSLDSGGVIVTPSNPVQLPLPARTASIDFFPNNRYAMPIQISPLETPLFVQVTAAQCNTDPTHAQSYPIRLSTALTGDTETFTAVETAPNSGLFRINPDVPTANAATHPVVSGDGILELLSNDTVTATLQDCNAAGSVSTTLLIDPDGVVFDSKSNQPIAGTTVQLIDVTGAGNGGAPGGAAHVFQADGVTAAPSAVVTGNDGTFSFPLVLPSTYRLAITAPAGFLFPSTSPPALLPPGRVITQPGSYGGSFVVANRGPVRIDVPLDAGASGGLFVQKTASKTAVEVGDFLDYTINVSNRSGIALGNLELSDWPPAGFVYVVGSARLNGRTVADPRRSAGVMGFALGTLANGAEDELRYRVAVAPGAESGSGINSAQAQSGVLRSNVASAKVLLIGGVFSDKAYLIGKVYADCNGNRQQEAGEPGIPGVRVWLADGTYAITDGDGKYSLYGLTPRTTVAAVDPTTLPTGAALEVLDNRNARDPGSQFVDLQNGELHKADFAVRECTPSIRAQISARRKALNHPDEITELARSLLGTAPQGPNTLDARALPASGTLGPGGVRGTGAAMPAAGSSSPLALGGAGGLGGVGDLGGGIALQSPSARPLFPAIPPASAPAAAPTAAPAGTPAAAIAAARPTSTAPLAALLPTLNDAVGFVGLTDDEILPSDQTRVRVKGPLGATLQLRVDGRLIPVSQVGVRTSLETRQVSAWEYIGVNLKPGTNVLALSATDPFGNVRGRATLRLRAPGPLAALRIVLPATAVADAKTAVSIAVQPIDADGLPVTIRLPLTLASSAGVWQVKDLNPDEPGTQVFTEGGEGRFNLLPPAHPETARITVRSGRIKASAMLTFTPDLRPLFGVGVVEGVLNLSRLNPASIVATSGTDGFEREIESLSTSFDDGKGSAAAHSQLFLKGKVLGSTLLTLGYDSDKPSGTTLFRDIQPDQYYPVYGDSSVKGFDAQSTGKLYVRMDQGTSYVLFGDYTTQSDNPARQLTQYTRALNGLKGRYQEHGWTVDGFASRTATTQAVLEISGNGTSGPYQLNASGVINSEQVDLIVRDRNQPGVVLSDTPLTPYVDYTIEPYSGRLLLKSPVPTVDANLDPVFIRISYELDQGGPRHTVAGVDARLALDPALLLGVTAIEDDNPQNRQKLDGLNFTAHLAAQSVLVGELAESNTDALGRGEAQRLEWRTQSARLQGRLWGIHTDTAFYNPSALQSAGQSQYGAHLGLTLDASNRLTLEALRSESPLAGGAQTGMSAALQHSLPGNVKLTAGLRHAAGTAQASPAPTTATLPASTPVEFTSAFVRLDAPVPHLPRANAFAQYERALNESAQVASFGGSYALGNAGKLYFNHESSNSLSGPYGLTPNASQYNTVFGLSTAVAADTQVFNEYRIGQSIDGKSAEDALGLRHLWRLQPGLGLSATAERIHPVSGASSDAANALTGAVSYTGDPDWKGTASLEWRRSQQSQSWLATAADAFKINDRWTLLTRGLYSSLDNRGASAGSQHLAQWQTGVAYRPADNDVWNGLALIGYKRDQDSTLAPGQQVDERAWILSTHLNVELAATWTLSARYAAKRAWDFSNGVASIGWSQLIGGRLTHDLNRHWDAGVQSYASVGLGQRQRAVGAEIGYILTRNLWLSVGYNVMGFNNPDLAGGAYTQSGVYLRLRYKFGGDLEQQAEDLGPMASHREMAAQTAAFSALQTAGASHAP